MNRPSLISAYTPSNTDPELLKRIFVQRERLLDNIVDRLARSMSTNDKHHILLVGPRGSGKTHLVTLVEHELRSRPELRDAMRIAWLGEDDTVTGLIDLAMGIAGQLATEYPDEFDPDYRASVRGLNADDAAESILKSIVARLGARKILLIMENLDRVFSGLGEMGQKKWRAFLQEYPRIATLATSQQLFEGIESRDEAFFGFFDIHHLKPLSVDDARELIRKIGWEQQKRDLVNYLDSAEGRYRVRALHHLAGGNHRMYVLLAEFLTKDSLDDLVEAFEALADELTPYFQERVRSLPSQQARLVQSLCNASGAMTVKQIAEETFIAEGSCSKQLGNLRQNGYVQSQKRGKESFYEMAEPLMRLCLEVKNQRGRPLKLVAKFLRAWFPESQLRESQRPASLASSRSDAYRAAALEVDMSLEKYLTTSLGEEIRKKIDAQQFDEAIGLSDELSCCDPVAASLFRAEALFSSGDFDGCEYAWSRIIGMADAPVAKRSRALFNRGVTYTQRGEAERALADYTAVIEMADAPAEQKAMALVNRGVIYSERNNVEQALADFTAVIDMADATVELKATALVFRSVALGKRGDIVHALTDYTAVIEMADAPAELKAMALRNRGVTYGQRGDIEQELADYTAAIEMADAPAEQTAMALVNRGVIYSQRNNVEQALADFTAVIDMADATVELKAMALRNRGVTYEEQYDVEQALTDFTAVIDMADAPAEHKATALVHRGATYRQLGDFEGAVADFTAVIDMADAPAKEKTDAIIHRGVTYGQQEDFERAVADFTAVVDMADASAEEKAIAFFNRGAMQWQLKQYGLARQSYRQVLAIPTLSPYLKTAASFMLPDTMVTDATRDQVVAALELAFRTGDPAVGVYGGTPGDLLAMVLRRGHQEWEGYIAALVPLYVQHKVAAKLGQGAIQTIELLAKEGYSESQLDTWNRAWQKAGQGCEDLELPLRGLNAAVEAIKTKSDRPLFDLPLEIREIVRPLLAKSLGE